MEKLKLYSYFRSSCAYRVRIALNLKGVPYDIVPIHLLKDGGQQNTNEYKKLNPSAQVPALLDNKVLIGQSMAILEYLEETFRTPALLPTKAADRAIVRQVCEVVNSGIQPLQNISVTNFLSDKFQMTTEQKNIWMQHWMSKGLFALETLLKEHSGTYCFGDQITFADCLLVPQVFATLRFKVDLTPFTKIREINERCMQLTDFIKASPDKQVDFES
jgi:maleylacetoacetate isomerase